MYKFTSTKIIELGSCAFRQPRADSHCKYLHGYRLTAKFWFTAKELDQNNWVVDFGGLKELKKLLQDQFDHTTCISKDDPKLDAFRRLDEAGVCDLRVMDGVGIEKFAEWCHAAADNFVGVTTNMRCRCVAVEVFEHENNSAIYSSKPEENESTVSVEVEKPVSKVKAVKKEISASDTTRPPFSVKKQKDKQSRDLWPKKQKNQWMSGDSTWGF
jgi:6-pyruvoyltetrahydropterin/6-carboxytetrahydropterin synthase